MAQFPIAVVEPDPKVRTKLAVQLGEEGVRAFADLDALAAEFPVGSPLVAVFGPGAVEGLGMGAIGDFNGRGPEVGTVAIVAELTTDALQQAMRAGVRDVLSEPVDVAQLADAVERAADSIRVAPGAVASASTADGPRARVVTVFSTKGGAGKSVVASNLAVVLAKRATGKVVLVDADLQFGDIAVMLKLAPQHTIVDAVEVGDRLDGSFITSLLVEHGPSGVLVLPAPIEPAAADQITSVDMKRVIEALRDLAEYVVVDTPAYFNDVVLGLLEDSDDIVMVGGMDIPNIKNVKLGLQTLRLLNMPISKLKLILNRANSKVKLDVQEVERTLGVKADCLMPSDIVVPQSVNKGVPAVLDAPKSGVARSIEDFADHLIRNPH